MLSVLYRILFSMSNKLHRLNTLIFLCGNCDGKMLAYKASNRGKHLFCFKCFTFWIKPPLGLFYRKKDYGKAGK